MNKISWKMIFEDFEIRYPKLRKKVEHYRPAGYLTIEIWLCDGLKMLYDYSCKKGKFLK